MKQPVVNLLLFVIIFLTSCGSKNMGPSSGFEMEPSPKTVSDKNTSQSKQLKPVERKLIKEGHIEFETDDIHTTELNVTKAIETYDGYIASDQSHNRSGRKTNTLVIRVPAKNFDLLLNEVTKGVKRFETKQIQVKDVTEEFVDVEARLKTQKELEDRYLELLDQAKTVTEMLEIEQQIGNLRSEIESVEGRLQYLQSQVDYATLNLTFFEQVPRDNKFVKQFKRGFKNGWENLIWFFVGLVNVWPFLFIAIALFWVIRRYRRKRKAKSDKIKPPKNIV